MITLWLLVSAALCSFVVNGSTPFIIGPITSQGSNGIIHKKNPETEKDRKAARNARFGLEELRQYFDIGIGGIPVLDPYQDIKPRSAVIYDKDLSGEISFQYSQIAGAKGFKTVKLQLDMVGRRLDIILDFPHLSPSVNYDANLKVDQNELTFRGFVNATLYNVRLSATAAFVPRNSKLQVSGFSYKLHSPHVEYNARNPGLLKSGQDVVETSRKNEASDVVKAVANDVAKKTGYATASSIVKELDKIFNNFTEKQILAWLLPDEP